MSSNIDDKQRGIENRELSQYKLVEEKTEIYEFNKDGSEPTVLTRKGRRPISEVMGKGIKSTTRTYIPEHGEGPPIIEGYEDVYYEESQEKIEKSPILKEQISVEARGIKNRITGEKKKIVERKAHPSGVIFGSQEYYQIIGKEPLTKKKAGEDKIIEESEELITLKKEDIYLYLEGKKDMPENLDLYNPEIGYMLFFEDRELWKKWWQASVYETKGKPLIGLLVKQIIEGLIQAATGMLGGRIIDYVKSLGLSKKIALSINTAIDITVKDVFYETIKQKVLYDKNPTLEDLNRLIVLRIIRSGVLKGIIDEEVLRKIVEYATKETYNKAWEELSK